MSLLHAPETEDTLSQPLVKWQILKANQERDFHKVTCNEV